MGLLLEFLWYCYIICYFYIKILVNQYLDNVESIKSSHSNAYSELIESSMTNYDILVTVQEVKIVAISLSYLGVPLRILKMIVSLNYFDKLFGIIGSYYRALIGCFIFMFIAFACEMILTAAFWILYNENIIHFHSLFSSIEAFWTWEPTVKDLLDTNIKYIETFYIIGSIVIIIIRNG